MKMRLLAVVVAAMAVLPSCAAIQPRMGMTSDELQRAGCANGLRVAGGGVGNG